MVTISTNVKRKIHIKIFLPYNRHNDYYLSWPRISPVNLLNRFENTTFA